MILTLVGIIQFFFAIVIGLYFWNMLRSQQGNRGALERESVKEMERLQRLRSITLTTPLAEKTRPMHFEEIVGQQEGIKALMAALCGPNPQHVIIYGPPGIGKTAAARLVLEAAKRNTLSPFTEQSKFVEIDATNARFDDRGIADPLIGSVHDPIYQGAGPLGIAGIPQPKPGAVTKAHGGILFIDEIGELHSIQMNKLLKILEDRKVFLESAYYSSEDTSIPRYIHDIFQNGLPADFRLVGATTRSMNEIPAAIRSRCLEVFFRPLTADEIGTIAQNAARKILLRMGPSALDVVKHYATNGREAVNMIQIAAGLVITDGRKEIATEDVEWVLNSGQYSPRMEKQIWTSPQIGVVNGLAVYGPNIGVLMEIEATALRVQKGAGQMTITGIVEEEQLGQPGHLVTRKSMAKGSIENVVTILRRLVGEELLNYDIHINLPGGVPVDGPSAGVSIATAVYSAITNRYVDNMVAMTGEVSVHGAVRPVGGVPAKVEAAKNAGVKRVLIPRDNWQELFRSMKGIEIIPIDTVDEVLELSLLKQSAPLREGLLKPVAQTMLTAAPSVTE